MNKLKIKLNKTKRFENSKYQVEIELQNKQIKVFAGIQVSLI